jgi:hypothetical protein
MTKLSRFACLCAFLLLPTFLLAQSQITTGVIQGTVSDSSGAVVTGAEVTITNLDTNLTKTLTTDNDGRFVALALQPGNYSVTVKKSGFSAVKYEKAELTVGQSLTLSPKLGVSGGTESVVVTDTGAAVDPTKTESSSTINQATVANTPVLGRKFEDLLTLTPGVSITQGPDGDEINFNGQRGIFNNISLDGGDYNNGFFGEQAGGQRAAVDITLEAVKEFQVVATGANAEFGRTAGGVVNVITKSGTNDLHGSIFHFQRHENLSSNASDGKPLKDFHREQFGGTIGGPIKKDKMFGFLAVEQITGNLQRDNLSTPIGDTPCAIAGTPDITNALDRAAIDANPECQRQALLNYYQTTLGQDESRPIRRPVHNTAVLSKFDWNVNTSNQFNASYNFNVSRKVNETFDVPTYGTSANGIEGTSYINAFNANLTSSFGANKVNEAHFTYSQEDRPREAVPSNVPADTAMGFATTFRFGHPFFLGPNIDETFKRFQIKDNFSIIKGKHNIKFGGDWLHSMNAQVFRGFFQSRYIFDSVTGFLRYTATPAADGFGPTAVLCWDGVYVTTGAPFNQACVPNPDPTQPTGIGPLLLYLQGANGDLSPATDAAGASDVSNEDFALFIQDKWQVLPNLTLNFGIRWEAQLLADPTVAPSDTVYAPFLGDPRFPSDGTIPDQKNMWQPRIGLAWDIANNQKSVLRMTGSIFNGHQNMLTQVGSITTNGVQQATIFVSSDLVRQGFATAPDYPGTVSPPVLPPGTFPLFSGVRVFDRNYKNPRIYTFNTSFEQEFLKNLSGYVDFTWSRGVYLTNFLNYNRADRADVLANFGIAGPFDPVLGETMVTSSRASSLYRGIVFGARLRPTRGITFEGNYTYSIDRDNDSNERDPFTDRSAPILAFGDPAFDLTRDWAYSDRDIRHRFNFIMSSDLPWGFKGNLRLQAHSAQPISGPAGRNSLRKDNAYSTIDWRLARPIRFGERYALIPTVEMFNSYNSKNNVNPLTTPGLFNFDGFLRQGVGDPRQVQLAIKFTF